MDAEHNREKVAQILQGAMQEFLARGYAGTSMEKVAAAAGVSKPTVYSYFKDKGVLFQALIENLAEKKFSSTFGSEPLAGDPKVVLRNIAEVTFKNFEDEEFSCFMRTIIGESGRFPELAKTCVTNLFKPINDVVVEYIISHPELKISDPEAATSLFIGTLVYYHISQNILHTREVMPIERSRVVDNLMEMMLKSIEQ
ncbi:TetR/AcrR family transcriptional regulator [Chamaesiphon polymorphus]|uniref:TetR family transcriptional regulator n=1 Tax=Chamaesiphon polymorphus CCALA 037 TaxID=2107692 RepID=A0A2T1GD88_9CYAN|nr:TetR/AcrR family transcriptional regulator [Chamaesiphon polymorphus]PSB55386.1 TetR family transcriptional regulator [Chamaesiphon polymorphus CCALA 037]